MASRGGIRIVAIVAILIAAGSPASAQKKSNSGHVTLIARMPDTLTFSINHGAPADPLSADSFVDVSGRPGAQIANSVTASWVLGRGHSAITTWAEVKRPPSPVLLAWAVPEGIFPFADRQPTSFVGFHLPPQPKDQVLRLDSLTITDANRAAASTIALSDSMTPERPAGLQDNDYAGTIKIRAQAIP